MKAIRALLLAAVMLLPTVAYADAIAPQPKGFDSLIWWLVGGVIVIAVIIIALVLKNKRK